MNKSKIPNFFILGAPKCGTTALQSYLSEHPDIYIPKGERNYFSKDINSGEHADLDSYLATFESSEVGQVIGEKSVWYLYSHEAIRNILKFNPNAKFIVMLRNPVDTAYSLYSQLLRSVGGRCQKEDVADFREAWYLQAERKNGKRIPKGCREPKWLQYGEVCKFGDQIERLFTQIPKDRVMIIFYKDFKEDTYAIYKKTLEFLGVPYDGRTEFAVINSNKTVIRPRLRRFLLAVVRLKEILRLPSFNFNILGQILEKTRPEQKRPPLSADFKMELVNYFRKDIKKLSALTGRDLSYWL